jgi:hypothetical protein
MSDWDVSARKCLAALLPSLSQFYSFPLDPLAELLHALKDFDVVTTTLMTMLLTIVASIREEAHYLLTVFYLFKVHLESFSSVLFGNVLFYGLMVVNTCFSASQNADRALFRKLLELVVDEPALASIILTDIAKNLTPEKNKSDAGIQKLYFLSKFVAGLLILERFDQVMLFPK